MKNTFLWCVLSVVVSCILSVGITVRIMQSPPVDLMPKSTLGQGTEEEYEFIIKEYSGRVAVFAKGEAKPNMMLDVYTQELPQADREMLRDGIKVKDFQTLLITMEDYTS